THGKMFTIDRDTHDSKRLDINNLEWHYLNGTGDFNSKEVTALRDESDIIITNPPFSKFRKFVKWIFDGGKNFLIIGNKNAITYKEVYPLVKDNKMWIGVTPMSKDLHFFIPQYYINSVKEANRTSAIAIEDGNILGRSPAVWFTNLEHGRRHEPLQLLTMADNIKYSRHKEIRGIGYKKYDNYDAIDIPFTDAIPADYNGVMGVPITFLDKYCPDQFEIIKFRKGNDDKDLVYTDKGEKISPYFRILIRQR
ncbi:MAG: adenine-specific methyltransferase EcoRI family protein, partial [Prevotella sp.]|nr:adenine-specific methyltransferase EcoRI family protein [Prevotella sp.]